MRPAIVIRPCALGDFILTLPLLAGLRLQGRPLLVAAHGHHLALAQAEDLIDDGVDIDRAGFHALSNYFF